METRPLLEVRHLSKQYRQPRLWPSRNAGLVALDDVSFAIRRASTTALMGSSGVGKTTLARCLCFLETADSGEIRFEGLPITKYKAETVSRPMQMIFQDPGASLNPHFTAFEVIEEPLRILRKGSREGHRRVVEELMEVTGLAQAWAGRKAWQFSGGQRARLGIARALAAEPKLLILDESLSGLDVSVRGQIANLLLDLQDSYALSYLLITHDQELANGLADQRLVLAAGRLADETGPAADYRQELVFAG